MTFPERAELDDQGRIRYADDTPPTDSRGADASKRAVRTFFQGLAFDVTAALVLLLLPVLSDSDWAVLDWQLLALSVAKTCVVTALSFAMRYFRIVPKTL